MKFAKECADSGGEICPFCGSSNTDRWEKSRSYWGIVCEEDDCSSRGEGIVIHELVVSSVVGISSGENSWRSENV
jgi:hypothetical protein